MKTMVIRWVCLAAVFVSSSSVAVAAKEVFQRTKPHVNVGTIGHVDHGKTALTAALAVAAKKPLRSTVVRAKSSDGAVEIDALTTQIKTFHPQYHIYDFDDEGTVLNLVTGALPIDAALLVVAAPQGPTEQTREHVLLARQVGVPAIVVFMNHPDQVDDPELLDLVEREIRELLTAYQYPGETTPIIRGSALGALVGEPEDLEALADLLDVMDEFIPRAR